MTQSELPRILVVDDEEAILETMTYTFMGLYEVLTATSGAEALEILDANAPVSVVITDQRMPEMTGVELLATVFEQHPETVRIMLTGFADADATLQAINDGHVYAYINKPWESAELKAVVKRGIEHHQLTMENSRLVRDLRQANLFLSAVMDRFGEGAIALDTDSCVQAINQPARAYLAMEASPAREPLSELLESSGLGELAHAVSSLEADQKCCFEDLDLRVDGEGHRLRVSDQKLVDPEGQALGRVVLFKEISHEPLRRRFDEILGTVAQQQGELRPELETALSQLAKLATQVRAAPVASSSMTQLAERVSRSQTALQAWLDVDDTLAGEDYPDAQLLVDRMRVATQRWPYPDEVPSRAKDLAARVDAYYDSGENRKQRVL